MRARWLACLVVLAFLVTPSLAQDSTGESLAAEEGAVGSVPQEQPMDSAIPDHEQLEPSQDGPVVDTPPDSPPSVDSAVQASGASKDIVVEDPDLLTEDQRDSILEYRLRTDPRAAALYRSPRKAFFYSLILPGAGQAYCGAWGKAAIFVSSEISVGTSLWYWSVKKTRDQERKARRFADAHWRQQRYEEELARVARDKINYNRAVQSITASGREDYCNSIYGQDASLARQGCVEGIFKQDSATASWSAHRSSFSIDGNWSIDSVTAFRQTHLKSANDFYRSLEYSEFVRGWDDVSGDSSTVTGLSLANWANAYLDNDPATIPAAYPWGTSVAQVQYIALRQRAEDYARMQPWFIGGIVLNHLVAAADAALTAQKINRSLYTLEKAAWWEGLHLYGGLAWASGPATRAEAILEF